MLCRLKAFVQPTTISIQRILLRTLILSYKILGDKPTVPDAIPILLFHGLLSRKKNWESIGKTISNMTERCVVVVDLRNHGYSPHTTSHKCAEMATDIEQLYHKLDIEQATLIGHGIGARAAMYYSLTSPTKVSSMVLVEMSPVSNPFELTEFFPRVMQTMQNMDFKGFKKVHKAKKAARKKLREIINDDATLYAVLSNVNFNKSCSCIGWMCNLNTLTKDFGHIVSFPKTHKKYLGPTLFIGGQYSDWIPPDDLPGIRELFPQAVVQYVPKTGHNIHIDSPKRFLEVAIAFLKNDRLDIIQEQSLTIPWCHGAEMFSRAGVNRSALAFTNLEPNLTVKRMALDLAYKIYGKQPAQSTGLPVIVLHGLLGFKKSWQSMCDKIAESTGRSIVGADLRNHGDSPHASSHTYPELAADVIKLMGKLSISKCSFIGHSMGGRTGMTVALTYPVKVEKLIVVDISPVSTAGVLNDFFPPLIKAMKAVDFKGAKNQALARQRAKEQLEQQGFEGVDFLLLSIGKQGNEFGWKFNSKVLHSSFPDIASFPSSLMSKTFNGPVLFIAGKESNYVPPGDITGIKKLFPQAELKYIEGVGHNVHAEDPVSFHKMAHDFLTKK